MYTCTAETEGVNYICIHFGGIRMPHVDLQIYTCIHNYVPVFMLMFHEILARHSASTPTISMAET